MHCVRQGISELLVGHRVRCSHIQWSAQRGCLQCKKNRAHQVGKADPTHPLPPATQPAAETKPEERQQLIQRSPARPQHYTKAERYDSYSCVACRPGCLLPFLANIC